MNLNIGDIENSPISQIGNKLICKANFQFGISVYDKHESYIISMIGHTINGAIMLIYTFNETGVWFSINKGDYYIYDYFYTPNQYRLLKIKSIN